MTIEQTIFVAGATGLIVGVAAFWLMLRIARKIAAHPRSGAMTPEQLRDVSDLTEQLQRLIQDIDAKIGDRLSRLDEAMIQADAKTAELRQASRSRPPASAAQLQQAEAETAPAHTGETPVPHLGAATQSPPREGIEEDEPVTLPGTWPVPPSRAQSNAQTPSRDAAQLKSPRHVEVLRLHRQGLDSIAIARKLQMDLGEVELVLRLHASAEPC
jgi:hypothetical protein